MNEGILAKESYQEKGQRARAAYALTAKGRDLAPILLALQEWGLAYIEGTRVPARIDASPCAEPQ